MKISLKNKKLECFLREKWIPFGIASVNVLLIAKNCGKKWREALRVWCPCGKMWSNTQFIAPFSRLGSTITLVSMANCNLFMRPVYVCEDSRYFVCYFEADHIMRNTVLCWEFGIVKLGLMGKIFESNFWLWALSFVKFWVFEKTGIRFFAEV